MKLKPPEPPFTLKRSLKLETLEYDSITMRFSLGVLSPTTADVSSNGFAAVVTENLVSSSDSAVSVTSDFGYVMRDFSYPDAVTATRDAAAAPANPTNQNCFWT